VTPFVQYDHRVEASTPTVLWRLFRPGDGRIRAVLLPGLPDSTLAFFVDDELDRAENYDTLDLAMFRADTVKRSLTDEGWQEDDVAP
jgi:hypothetical protein